jgi:cyanophycinase
VLVGTPALAAMKARYRDGAVVGGTSAGAAALCDPMLTGNQRKPGEDTVGYYGDTYPRIARDYIDLEPGLGFLPDVILDQHFIKRERENRLISVVLEHPRRIGVGIDESTALLVRPGQPWQIVGASAAIVFDARDARITAAGTQVLGAAGIRMSVLPAGSSYDPTAGRATLPH